MVVGGDIFGGGSADEEGGAWGLGFECGLHCGRGRVELGVLGCLKRREGFWFVCLFGCVFNFLYMKGEMELLKKLWFPFFFSIFGSFL